MPLFEIPSKIEIENYIKNNKIDTIPEYRSVFSLILSLNPSHQNQTLRLLIDGALKIQDLIDLRSINNDSVARLIATANDLNDDERFKRNKIAKMLKDESSNNVLNDYRVLYGNKLFSLYTRSAPIDRALTVVTDNDALLNTIKLTNSGTISRSRKLPEFDPSETTFLKSTRALNDQYIQNMLNTFSHDKRFESNYQELVTRAISQLGLHDDSEEHDTVRFLDVLKSFDIEARIRLINDLVLDTDPIQNTSVEFTSDALSAQTLQTNIEFTTWRYDQEHTIEIAWGDGTSSTISTLDGTYVTLHPDQNKVEIGIQHVYSRIEPKTINIRIFNVKTVFIDTKFIVKLSTSNDVNVSHLELISRNFANTRKRLGQELNELIGEWRDIIKRRVVGDVTFSQNSLQFEFPTIEIDDNSVCFMRAFLLYTDNLGRSRVQSYARSFKETEQHTFTNRWTPQSGTARLYVRVYDSQHHSLIGSAIVDFAEYQTKTIRVNAKTPIHFTALREISTTPSPSNAAKRSARDELNFYHDEFISNTRYLVFTTHVASSILSAIYSDNNILHSVLLDAYSDFAFTTSKASSYIARITDVVTDSNKDLLDVYPNKSDDFIEDAHTVFQELLENGNWSELYNFLDQLDHIKNVCVLTLLRQISNGIVTSLPPTSRYINPRIATAKISDIYQGISNDPSLVNKEIPPIVYQTNVLVPKNDFDKNDYDDITGWLNLVLARRENSQTFKQIENRLNQLTWPSIQSSFQERIVNEVTTPLQLVPYQVFTNNEKSWLEFYDQLEVLDWINRNTFFRLTDTIKSLASQTIANQSPSYNETAISDTIVKIALSSTWDLRDRLFQIVLRDTAEDSKETSFELTSQYIEDETSAPIASAEALIDRDGEKIVKPFEINQRFTLNSSDFTDNPDDELGLISVRVRVRDVFDQLFVIDATRFTPRPARDDSVLSRLEISGFTTTELTRASLWNRYFSYGLLVSLNSSLIASSLEDKTGPDAALMRDDTPIDPVARFIANDSKMTFIINDIQQLIERLDSRIPIWFSTENQQ